MKITQNSLDWFAKIFFIFGLVLVVMIVITDISQQEPLKVEVLPPTQCVFVDERDRRIVITTSECAADWLLQINEEKKLIDEWLGF